MRQRKVHIPFCTVLNFDKELPEAAKMWKCTTVSLLFYSVG